MARSILELSSAQFMSLLTSISSYTNISSRDESIHRNGVRNTEDDQAITKRVFDLLLCALSYGWSVGSDQLSLARAMLLSRLYAANVQHGFAHAPCDPNDVPRDKFGTLDHRRVSYLRARFIGFLWSVIVPCIAKLTQTLCEIDSARRQDAQSVATERLELQKKLSSALSTLDELTSRLVSLEDSQDENAKNSELLDLQLKMGLSEIEIENLKCMNERLLRQVTDATETVKCLRSQLEEQHDTISSLLFDMSSLLLKKQQLDTYHQPLLKQGPEACQRHADKELVVSQLQQSLAEEVARGVENGRKLGVEFARLENQRLDSCVFSSEKDDSEDSIVIITEDLDRTPKPPKLTTPTSFPKSPITQKAVSLSPPKPVPPVVSSSEQAIPVFTSPRPSLPPRKSKLKPLLLASRFATSSSSRRLFINRRSPIVSPSDFKKDEDVTDSVPRTEHAKLSTGSLNPQAPVFTPRLTSATSLASAAVALSRMAPQTTHATPRTTRVTSVKLIKSRIISRTMKAKDTAAIAREKKHNTASISNSDSRTALGEMTNK